MLHSDTAVRKLPYYVEPAADEAMMSWLLRLATRMEISIQTILVEVFGMDYRVARADWWRRPHPWLLKKISDKTGVNVERLRQMTLTTWAPRYFDDEADGRFSHRQHERLGSTSRSFRFVSCPECLKADPQPYIRLSWTIGWVAVCPRHAALLITECTRCHTEGLRSSRFSLLRPFMPLTCVSCEQPLAFEKLAAHPSVIQLQEALLRGKRENVTELCGMGAFNWRELVALADVLIGMFRINPSAAQKSLYIDQFQRKFDVGWPISTSDRYSALALIAWLIKDWSNESRSYLGRSLLTQWLSGKPCHRSHNGRRIGMDWQDPFLPERPVIEPEIRERLAQLV